MDIVHQKAHLLKQQEQRGNCFQLFLRTIPELHEFLDQRRTLA